MAYDVVAVRAQYPALADGRAWLDGAAGTQVPQVVIDAVAQTYRIGVSNQVAPFEASSRGTGIVAQARQAVADLVGASDPRGVVFGPTMTALTYRFAAALGATWRAGDEIVVTQLDHDANVRPWVQAARRAGATVRTAAVDPRTAELPVDGVRALLGARTRLVAVTAASNLVGTRPDVPAITAAARAVGAVSFVDGVHHTPHVHVDLAALGADLYATSAYKWAGPHLAAVAAVDPGLLRGCIRTGCSPRRTPCRNASSWAPTRSPRSPGWLRLYTTSQGWTTRHSALGASSSRPPAAPPGRTRTSWAAGCWRAWRRPPG